MEHAMLKNEIVVYQPNETVRLDVRLENETVWLTQSQLSERKTNGRGKMAK